MKVQLESEFCVCVGCDTNKNVVAFYNRKSISRLVASNEKS